MYSEGAFLGEAFKLLKCLRGSASFGPQAPTVKSRKALHVESGPPESRNLIQNTILKYVM